MNYWFKQLIAVAVALTCGILGVTGAVGIISFGISVAMLTYIYLQFYLRINDSEFGGITSLIFDGMMATFATFLVCNISVITKILLISL